MEWQHFNDQKLENQKGAHRHLRREELVAEVTRVRLREHVGHLRREGFTVVQTFIDGEYGSRRKRPRRQKVTVPSCASSAFAALGT